VFHSTTYWASSPIPPSVLMRGEFFEIPSPFALAGKAGRG
jgi:hypothetical protein